MGSGLGATTAKFDVRQASWAVLQQRQQVFGMMDKSGWGSCEEGVPSCLLVYGVRFESTKAEAEAE